MYICHIQVSLALANIISNGKVLEGNMWDPKGWQNLAGYHFLPCWRCTSTLSILLTHLCQIKRCKWSHWTRWSVFIGNGRMYHINLALQMRKADPFPQILCIPFTAFGPIGKFSPCLIYLHWPMLIVIVAGLGLGLDLWEVPSDNITKILYVGCHTAMPRLVLTTYRFIFGTNLYMSLSCRSRKFPFFASTSEPFQTKLSDELYTLSSLSTSHMALPSSSYPFSSAGQLKEPGHDGMEHLPANVTISTCKLGWAPRSTSFWT